MAHGQRMLLNLFLGDAGHHQAAWRHPSTDISSVSSVQHYIELARSAEAATIDSVFIADGLCVQRDLRSYVPRNFEPISLLTAIAAHTSHIGLIGTMSTTFSEPYNVARSFASLDHISGGRAGWNIVTTAEDRSAANFGHRRMPGHTKRYQRAHEFVDVVRKLWDSWELDAITADAVSGQYVAPSAVHEIRHRGLHFDVRGPLNIPRSPQARPLLVQAGSSPEGRAFAATHADVVFTVQQTLEEAQGFSSSLKTQAVAQGRAAGTPKILPGLFFVLGSTEAEARRVAAELDDRTEEEPALALLNSRLGTAFTEADLDSLLPPLPEATLFDGHQGRYQLIRDMAAREKLTVRQTMRRFSSGRGHHSVIGTPEQLAATMRRWIAEGAADGFTLMPALYPQCLVQFTEQVVPLLRRSGDLRENYEEGTLRDRYGPELSS
ncbi:LLM class flavin-dependent oxidoreductase [Streptomyces sp. NPDC006285]|uniref:LLM class flavin-dependent oxidoreductase n=1 Tax=Streptomyces sp. NPDC006285 TaxID=3364742 RepID=UPI00367C83A3